MQWNDMFKFWFGEVNDARHPTRAYLNTRVPLWFNKNEAMDIEAREKYGHWLDGVPPEVKTDEDALCQIILYDQIPRNIFRGSPRAFSYDHRALELAKKMILEETDQKLSGVERVFAYLPFEHSEKLADQVQSVELFRELVPSIAVAEFSSTVLEYAIRHHAIIARFGRFPHRNAILGRTSTEEELKFLSEPNSSF